MLKMRMGEDGVDVLEPASRRGVGLAGGRGYSTDFECEAGGGCWRLWHVEIADVERTDFGIGDWKGEKTERGKEENERVIRCLNA
jgi:hypothetical protein